MLTLKDAIKRAFEHFELIYEGEKVPNRLLEEIEYDDSAATWNVVIGFDSDRITTKTERNRLAEILGDSSALVAERERKYKQIRLKGEDGSLIKFAFSITEISMFLMATAG